MLVLAVLGIISPRSLSSLFVSLLLTLAILGLVVKLALAVAPLKPR